MESVGFEHSAERKSSLEARTPEYILTSLPFAPANKYAFTWDGIILSGPLPELLSMSSYNRGVGGRKWNELAPDDSSSGAMRGEINHCRRARAYDRKRSLDGLKAYPHKNLLPSSTNPSKPRELFPGTEAWHYIAQHQLQEVETTV